MCRFYATQFILSLVLIGKVIEVNYRECSHSERDGTDIDNVQFSQLPKQSICTQFIGTIVLFTLYLHYMHQRTLEEPGKRGQETYNYLSLLPALSACFAQDFQNENTQMMQGYSITSLLP